VSSIDTLKPIADAARAGDSAAVRQLLDALAPAMLGVVRAVLGRADRDVEDVLQEALVGVVQGLATFRGESSIMHFARAIALRRSLDQRRKRARRAPEVALLHEDPSSVEDLSADSSGAVLVSKAVSPIASVVAERRREAFRVLLGDLRPEQADAFAQRVLFGYSKEEIAKESRVSVETVKSRLRLAKAALRARIKDDPALLELSELDDDDLA